MKVAQVTINNPQSFTGRKRTLRGAIYNDTNKGTLTGFLIGSTLTGCLITANLRDLNTYKGKRLLIEDLKNKGKSLDDISKKVIKRDDTGKVIPVLKASERSKKLIRNNKLSMFASGVCLTALLTGFGRLTDINKNLLRARKADDCIGCKD